MDVYQKVLTKLYEVTGGKDNVDADLTDILKKEGFLPSIDEIMGKMSTEGWLTETRRPKVVRITHWGVMAARKLESKTPDSANILDKQAHRLQAEVKEFIILVEEFDGKSTPENFVRIEKKLSEINAVAAKIKEHL